MEREIILIGNPVAGGNAVKKIERAAGLIRRRGFDVRVLLTGKRGDAETFARGISKKYRATATPETLQPSPLIIAAGGDGTYNEVANGLVHSDVPMAILPLGTTSVLAKELTIPNDIAGALDVALHGRIQRVHLGEITLKDSNKLQGTSHKSEDKETDNPLLVTRDPSLVTDKATRHFLLMAGIGFDGETIYSISERAKKHTGKGAYILSGIKTVLSYDPQLLSIKYRESSGGPQEKSIQGYAAIVSKASCYGGAFRVAPDAKLTDPFFYVFLTHKKGRLDLLRYVLGIVTGRNLKYPDISYFRAVELSVEGKAHVQVDGDYAGKAPARVRIAPDALYLVTGS